MTESESEPVVTLRVRDGHPEWFGGSGYDDISCTFESIAQAFIVVLPLAEQVRGDEEAEFRAAIAEVLNSDAGIEDWHEEDREVWSINEVNDSFLPDKMVARVAAVVFEGELGARLRALYS